jgi:hypothetical protein
MHAANQIETRLPGHPMLEYNKTKYSRQSLNRGFKLYYIDTVVAAIILFYHASCCKLVCYSFWLRHKLLNRSKQSTGSLWSTSTIFYSSIDDLLVGQPEQFVVYFLWISKEAEMSSHLKLKLSDRGQASTVFIGLIFNVSPYLGVGRISTHKSQELRITRIPFKAPPLFV